MEAEPTGGGVSPHSAALVRRLVESAVEKCQAIDGGRRVERVPLRRYAATLAADRASAAIAVFSLGPAYLRHALSALLDRVAHVEAAAPYSIEVTPGQRHRAARRRSDASPRKLPASTPSRRR